LSPALGELTAREGQKHMHEHVDLAVENAPTAATPRPNRSHISADCFSAG
jgi:hypothetical protein